MEHVQAAAGRYATLEMSRFDGGSRLSARRGRPQFAAPLAPAWEVAASSDEGSGWSTELHWDDVVDVICAGSGPGVLAHAISCADLDRRVLLADAMSTAEVSDADTAAYLDSMTEDVGPLIGFPLDLELPVTRAQPVPARTDRRARIEPFVGSRLRGWAAQCVASPFGVLYSDVPDAGTTAMRTDAGETIQAAVIGEYRPDVDRPGPALIDWLHEEADERAISRNAGSALQRLIFEHGRVAGAALTTPSGTRLVRATAGVALSMASAPPGARWPSQPGLRDTPVQVGIVGRKAGRFGRVELLALPES